MNPAKSPKSAHPDMACVTLLQNKKSGSSAAALQTRRNSQEHYTMKDTFGEEVAGQFPITRLTRR